MRYRGEQLHLQTNQAAVLANGSYNLLKLDRYLYFVYGREGMIPENLDNTLFYYKYKVVAPARLAGSALVVQETLDQVLSIRKAWRFNRGERRVRRLPTLAYDSLQPDTNGMATADTVDVYNGAPDHYEWALLGKREMLVPYNSYAVHQKGLAYGDILKSRFINPDLLRYELHRVWVVEATLRKGFSHPYAKRRFYLDEDSWQILAADIYDKDGVLTRPRRSIRSTTTMCRWSPAPWKRSTTSRAAATSSMGWTTTSRCTTSAYRSGRATSPAGAAPGG